MHAMRACATMRTPRKGTRSVLNRINSGPASAVACPRRKPKGRRGITACLSERRTFTPRKGQAVAKVRKRTWQTKTGERIAWVADYFAPGPDGNKRRCTKTFPTKKEASAWLAHTVVEIKQGVHTPAHLSPTVLKAGEAWIAQAETDGLERASVRQYRQHLDLHIGPFLGHITLAELTPAAV